VEDTIFVALQERQGYLQRAGAAVSIAPQVESQKLAFSLRSTVLYIDILTLFISLRFWILLFF
jgi:hypothetical protein